jgi:hypothetical protein
LFSSTEIFLLAEPDLVVILVCVLDFVLFTLLDLVVLVYVPFTLTFFALGVLVGVNPLALTCTLVPSGFNIQSPTLVSLSKPT